MFSATPSDYRTRSVSTSRGIPLKTRRKHRRKTGFRNNYIAAIDFSLADLSWCFNRFFKRLPPKPSVPTPVVVANLNFIASNASAGAAMIPAVTWLGHASMLVQASGLNVLTDPVFSNRIPPLYFKGYKRAQCPGIALETLPRIDVVVISHNHYDHLDRASVIKLAKRKQDGGPPLFLVPLGLKEWLRNLGITHAIELDWWGRHIYTSTEAHLLETSPVEFHFTPAQHWSSRTLFDRNKTLWGSWAILGADFHWFFTGDTGYSKDFKDIRRHFAVRQTAEQGGGFDIALIAVGACLPRWFMERQHVDLNEAVQLHLDLNAKSSVGVHWGTFALADEPLDQPIHELGAALSRKGVSAKCFFLMDIGETRRMQKRVI